MLGVGYVLPVLYLVYSLKNGEVAGPNPWGASGLEWETPSPPPTENFAVTPRVTTRAVRIHAARRQGDEALSDAVAHADAPHGHAAHHPALQHQFETMGQQKEAAVLGMWAFLITEILFFGGLFMAYMLYRIWYHDAFVRRQHVDHALAGALLNTVVLIASSLTMALAVRAAQTNQRKATVNWLISDDGPRGACSSASRSSSTPTSSSIITCPARISCWAEAGTCGAAGGEARRPRRDRGAAPPGCKALRRSSSASTSR